MTSDKRANRDAADWRRGVKNIRRSGRKTAWDELGLRSQTVKTYFVCRELR